VALSRVMAFVLIACPCAFVFALPLTFGLSLNKAVEKGMIVKSSNVFEKLSETRNIFFDKTGTLTNGIFKILKWKTEELSPSDKAAILAIENKSSHPIARSITTFLSNENLPLPDVQDFKYNYTKGIEARVNGHHYEIISDTNINDSNEINEIITTRIVINKDGNNLSEIFLGDSLKSDAKYVVNILKKNGYKVHVLSGDNEQNVTSTARKLGISDDYVFWSKTPEEKEQIIKNSEQTLMVGDGLNDTSAFSSADVGVSVQGSVEESLKVSDAYLLNNSLINIVDLLEFGDITKNSINRNTRFSVAYNITAGTLALFGFINPLIAAVLMPLSSVLLIGSSLYGYNKLSLKRKGIEI
jgi:Cu2+-exporting ATPase/Cu+-exporting ATPase